MQIYKCLVAESYLVLFYLDHVLPSNWLLSSFLNYPNQFIPDFKLHPHQMSPETRLSARAADALTKFHTFEWSRPEPGLERSSSHVKNFIGAKVFVGDRFSMVR